MPMAIKNTKQKLLGQALICLALYPAVHPEASISHIRAFLFNMDLTVSKISPPSLLCHQSDIGLLMGWVSRPCLECGEG